MKQNLAKFALDRGAAIKPLLIPPEHTNGTGLMNPSVFCSQGKIMVNIRHVNYTFYHSEKKLFNHPFGPLTYLHPENDMHLRTWNWYAEIDPDLNMTRLNKIDTSDFPEVEAWDFVGLEDARIIDWGDGRVYTTGVRRDIEPTGQGRMELCEIQVTPDNVKETSRRRIEPPNDPTSYCEKNWMPIDDMPYCYVKWSNPAEIVRIDPESQTSETIHRGNPTNMPRDLRGGSQVLGLDSGSHLALTHEVDLFNSEVGRKDAVYYHRFVVWDQDWNVSHFTPEFSIMGGQVEFAVGMTFLDQDVYITWGFQDNAAFVMRMKKQDLMDYIYE